MSASSSTKDNKPKRFRNFASILYPESAPEDWLEILKTHMIPAFISPLHDKDFNQSGRDHDEKKPHYHIILLFDSVKTIEQAQDIFDSIGAVKCKVVNSIRGYSRYLCHLDNPEKAQYVPNDVISLCGADYFNIIDLPIDRYVVVGEMMDFCVTNSIISLSELIDYARVHRFEWFRALCDNSVFIMREYLKSCKWTEEYNRSTKEDS